MKKHEFIEFCLFLLVGAFIFFILLTGCVSQKKYKQVQRENKVLRQQIVDYKDYYTDLLLKEQKRK